MLELPSGTFINLSQVCYIQAHKSSSEGLFQVKFEECSLYITKEDMDKIREVSNLGMSILNEVDKT